MKNIIYSGLTILLLLQGCGSDDSNSGNGEDLNANPTENANVPRGTTETATVDDLALIEEAKFIDLPINPTFTRVNGSIVKEDQSNLYWQDERIVQSTKRRFADAQSYCETLTIEEIDSWRLPTYNELLTLVDYGRDHPAIDPIFSHTNDEFYWVETKYSGGESLYRWVVSFERGVVDYAHGAYPSHFTTEHNVRCVSDEFTKKRVTQRNFSKDGDVVTDHNNRLLWEDSLTSKITNYHYSEIDAHCENLTLGEFTGWRVPTVKELISLVNIEEHDPAIDDTFVSTAYDKGYWTSVAQSNGTASGSNEFKWNLSFKAGEVRRGGSTSESFNKYVRCVKDQ